MHWLYKYIPQEVCQWMYYKALYVTFGFACTVAQQRQEELLSAYLLYSSSHLPAQLPVSLSIYKGAIFICHVCT